MSYIRKFIYEIVPIESYHIIRNCPICGCKSFYHNTNHFRVNANGKLIDIWLIYQCEKCKHTYNLTIHERLRPEKLPPQNYNKFMENNKDLAMEYGTTKSIFLKNKAEINECNIGYKIISIDEKIEKNTLSTYLFERYCKQVCNMHGYKNDFFSSGDLITLENSYGLKLRADRITAEILQISRNKVKQLEKNNSILIQTNSLKQTINIWIQSNIT